MSSLITRKLFTLDDYQRMEKAGIFGEDDRVELINGEFLLMSPPGPRHSAAVARANQALVNISGNRAIVWPQNSAVLNEYNVPLPDIVLLNPRDDFYNSKLPGPQDILLIIEMADSSLSYDRKVKAQLYAEAGIQEYWIVDIRHDRLLVNSDPHQKGYRAVREFHRGDSIAPELLPDSKIPVDSLLP